MSFKMRKMQVRIMQRSIWGGYPKSKLPLEANQPYEKKNLNDWRDVAYPPVFSFIQKTGIFINIPEYAEGIYFCRAISKR